jgi:hypothetical protein
VTRDRCRWAISIGSISTRCDQRAGHGDRHEGAGLERFPDQRISWLPNDPRQFETDRPDEHAWERPR